MAYGAVVSLMHTLSELLNSSNICLVHPSRNYIGITHTEVENLHDILKSRDEKMKRQHRIRKRFDALHDEIREAVCGFEDVIESHVSGQIRSQSDNSNGDRIQFSIQLKHLHAVMYYFRKKMTEMGEKYDYALRTPKLDDDDDDSALPTAPDYNKQVPVDGKKSRVVGLSDKVRIVKERLINSSPGFRVTSVVGMAGIGKTTLAREIYQDPAILNHFDCHAWVTIGKGRDLVEIEDAILVALNLRDLFFREKHSRRQTVTLFQKRMAGKKYLVIVDDVWEPKIWTKLQYLFPDNEILRVLQTTRLHSVAYTNSPRPSIKMRLLNKEESWDLFCDKVFDGKRCPSSLEKVGKKIAEICDGLPLTIITVADLLYRAKNKSLQYWTEVAEQKNHQLFVDAYAEISKVLYSSYTHLPQHLRLCFLYMGVFPRKYETPQSYLVNLWSSVGLVEPDATQTLEDCIVDCLQELVSDTVLMLYKESAISLLGKGKRFKSTIGIKTCGLHSSFWYLCNTEASKNKVFQVLDNLKDALEEGIKRQRLLCIHNNVLFGIKDVYASIEDKCALTARSLLCFGPYHRYPVPLCYSLLLLRELDALKIRFYEFPMEVLKLVQLRYLAITYNGKLPPSISKLWKLQVLIVERHLRIKLDGAPLYLPMEIWDMKELKHLQIMGRDLRCRHFYGTQLPNLLTLSGVGIQSCTKGVLEGVPNLNKLGIKIELQPDAIGQPWKCLDHISCLKKLESLKCVIMNPAVFLPPSPLPVFPSSLRKLTLSGLRYPWECINVIATLRTLEVLKLRNNAFQGPTWEVEASQLCRLKVLLIEDSDLVQWNAGGSGLPMLRRLSLKHCYKLQKFHWVLCTNVQKVELIDCHPSGVACALKNIHNAVSHPDVYVHCSWDDKSPGA